MSRPNTFRNDRGFSALVGLLALAAAWVLPGCGPKYTYPADTVPQAIEDISLKEYQLTVNARLVGTTVGALLYLDDLIDEKGQVPKEVHEQMGKVMQVVTRVALSTDAAIDFCTVVLRDRRNLNELTITRSLDDTKRANADAIGIEESINRTLFTQGKYAAEASEQDFTLKDVRREQFLTDQIVQRIRFNFSKEAPDDQGAFALVDGSFDESSGRKVFRFSVIGLKSSDDPHATVLNVFKVVNDVLLGYKFEGFDAVEIQDYLNRLKLVLNKQTFFDYQTKRISEAQILERFLSESQSIQEAFKLFGFALPNE